MIEFLSNMNLVQLCLTLSVHQNKIVPGDETFGEYLNLSEQKIKAVETFFKFGQSCKTECDSDKFVSLLQKD